MSSAIWQISAPSSLAHYVLWDSNSGATDSSLLALKRYDLIVDQWIVHGSLLCIGKAPGWHNISIGGRVRAQGDFGARDGGAVSNVVR
eukprot:scaffold237057_cov23-Prasinocladus_malaysianus.AAC.1